MKTKDRVFFGKADFMINDSFDIDFLDVDYVPTTSTYLGSVISYKCVVLSQSTSPPA